MFSPTVTSFPSNISRYISTVFPVDKNRSISFCSPVRQIVVFLFATLSTIRPWLMHDCFLDCLCLWSYASWEGALKSRSLILIFWPSGASPIHGFDPVPQSLREESEARMWIGWEEAVTTHERSSSATKLILCLMRYRIYNEFLEPQDKLTPLAYSPITTIPA